MHWVLRKYLRPLEIVFITRYLLIVLHRLWSLTANQTDIIKTVESILQSCNTWGATWYFPIAGTKAGVLTCRQISSSLWEMSRVLCYENRTVECAARVGVHFFRQISVSTTLLNRGRVYASRLSILSTQWDGILPLQSARNYSTLWFLVVQVVVSRV